MTYQFDTANQLSKTELRALATAIQKMTNGAENFLSALREAKAENGGGFVGEKMWHQIANEISILDAAPPTPTARL